MPDDVAIILLTFNSIDVIERTVAAARRVSATLYCVDSGSTDGTLELLAQLGCQLHNRPFKNYADQRNWAIQTLGNNHAWQLHLDADEILDDAAVASIRSAVATPDRYSGFVLHRRTYFLGRALRFGGTGNWHMRLFRSGSGACEDRLYDQHFICSGQTRVLPGQLHDMNVGNLSEWTARHNRWSDLEVHELLRPESVSGRLEAKVGSDPRKRRRLYKGIYYRAPPIARAALLFFYRYVVQLGFLDGREGLLYVFFQTLWFRTLVDVKLSEARNAERRAAARGIADVVPQSAGTTRR